MIISVNNGSRSNPMQLSVFDLHIKAGRKINVPATLNVKFCIAKLTFLRGGEAGIRTLEGN